MLIVIADIQLKQGVEDEFKQFVSESNKILSKIDGFISRKLLKSNDGKHKIIVEHQSMETFQNMHKMKEHDQVREKALTFMETNPMPKIFEIISI